ncbi:hypothetical protein E2542_SST02736 [Spatholobus suberectus]|nr:hypothetical protein E2542_SST02736 [Spatholobus suberectus]
MTSRKITQSSAKLFDSQDLLRMNKNEALNSGQSGEIDAECCTWLLTFRYALESGHLGRSWDVSGRFKGFSKASTTITRIEDLRVPYICRLIVFGRRKME